MNTTTLFNSGEVKKTLSLSLKDLKEEVIEELHDILADAVSSGKSKDYFMFEISSLVDSLEDNEVKNNEVKELIRELNENNISYLILS
ncbi:hypothetical protein [Aliarcobacter butzleri]|uniref:hypothetical protein n=1 Tax=Aliarcobacter butzleri TaxID=28197 RepID=UPI00126A60D7|nr:hypothetical protein [Aliarcobacter butzleri]